MEEIIERPSSFSDEPEGTVSQPGMVSEPSRAELEAASDGKVANSVTLTAPNNDTRKDESCTVVMPESKTQKGGSIVSYLLSHPLMLLLTLICLVAIVYLILNFLRGFFPWMQN